MTGYDSAASCTTPTAGTWTATGKMTKPRHSHVAILLPDGKVLVAGGHVVPDDQPTDSAELYDPDTGTWTAIANMHAQREAIEAFLQPDGTVLVVGSGRGDPQSVETYDPATGAWTVAAGLARPGTLVDASTTLLSDGRVLVTDADVRFGRSRAVRPEYRVLDHRRAHAPVARNAGDPAARWHRPRGRWP